MKRRPPLDAGGRPTTTHELQLACGIVDRSGVVPVLAPHMDAEVGRHRTISLRGLLVSCQLNALARHHRAHLIGVARVINALTDDQRAQLGIVNHDPRCSYDRVERSFVKLAGILDAGLPGISAGWFANRLARAAVPEEMRTSSSVAVDGTDVETWGALHGEAMTVTLDGEAAETQLADQGAAPKPRRAQRKAKVLGRGADGRHVYTADRDARAGHRSATNSRPAGPYVGYELHLAVQARDVRWTNYVDKVTLSDEAPGVVTTVVLVPAGHAPGTSRCRCPDRGQTGGGPHPRRGLGSGLLAKCPSHHPPQVSPGRHPGDLPGRYPPTWCAAVLRRGGPGRRTALLEPAAR